MRTLAPAQAFLRVVDKFFAAFALDDQELSSGATLLYLNLFRLPPLPSPGKAADVSPDNGRKFSAEFESLFAIWPRKQDKLNAARAFAALRQAGELPPLDELLAIIPASTKTMRRVSSLKKAGSFMKTLSPFGQEISKII